jgi:hypothetical protein
MVISASEIANQNATVPLTTVGLCDLDLLAEMEIWKSEQK